MSERGSLITLGKPEAATEVDEYVFDPEAAIAHYIAMGRALDVVSIETEPHPLELESDVRGYN